MESLPIFPIELLFASKIAPIPSEDDTDFMVGIFL